MRKQVVIDIDGILWLIGEPWHQELIKINPNCPFPGLTNWQFFEGYMTKEEALGAVKAVHMNQDKYKPFNGAHKLIDVFWRNNYKVVIASHRHPDSYDVTTKWLNDNYIRFHELYTGMDKHPYLDDPATVLFIDDAPNSQQLAIDKGIPVMSIKYQYNKHMNNVIFYDDFGKLVSGATAWAIANGVDTGIPNKVQASVTLRVE